MERRKAEDIAVRKSRNKRLVKYIRAPNPGHHEIPHRHPTLINCPHPVPQSTVVRTILNVAGATFSRHSLLVRTMFELTSRHSKGPKPNRRSSAAHTGEQRIWSTRNDSSKSQQAGTPLTPISYLLLFVQFGELILLLFTRLHMLGYIVADSFVSPEPRMPLAPRLSPQIGRQRVGRAGSTNSTRGGRFGALGRA